jgi:hypothetical protein
MSEQNNHPLNEESLYIVTAKDKTEDGKAIIEVAQYRKGKFWFFGWQHPEPTDKFESWKELVLSIKEI